MPIPAPYPGLVICYSYLWRRQFRAGEEEGAKDRPCAVILASGDKNDQIVVTVLPITHLPPDSVANALEIPGRVKSRLGLDADRSWVVLSEVNRFVWPGPDLRSVSRNTPDQFAYGDLPPRLFHEIKTRFIAVAKAQRIAVVPRGE